MPDLSLIFDILARDGASGTFRSVGDAAEDAGRRGGSGIASITASARGLAATLAGAGVITLLQQSVGAASDLAETTNKSNVIFGQNASQVRSWAQDSARSFGLSRAAALEAASGLSNMLTQLGYTGDAAVATSTSTVQLAADLGSFNNLETGDVLDRINGALRGEYDSLQLLIPNINAARVEQEAMAATGKKNADQLTAQEKAAAVLAIVQRDGAAAQNDFAETSGGLANQAKIAQAQFADFQAELGQRFLPAATGALTFLNDYGIPVLGGVADTAGAVVDVVGGLVDVVGAIPGPVLAGVAAMTAFALLKEPVTSALETIYIRGLQAGDGLRAAGGAAGLLRTGAGGLVSFLGGPWGIAIGAATIGLGFLVSELGEGDEAAQAAAAAQRTYADAIREANGVVNESVRQAAAKAAQDADLLDVTDRAGISAGLVTDALTGNAAAYNQVRAALLAYQEANTTRRESNLGVTSETLNANAEAAQGAAVSLEGLAGTLPATQAEMEQLARATEATTGATGAAISASDLMAASQEQLAEKTSAAKQQVDAIRLALEQLGGSTVNTNELQAALGAAVAEASDKMKDLEGNVLTAAGGLDANSEAGRAAIDVLGGIRDAGLDLISNQAQLGESTSTLTGRATSLREQFITAAGQMGINAERASYLADQYGLIPDQVVTTVQSNTAQASRSLADIGAQLRALDGTTVEVSVLARAAGNAVSSLFGFPQRAEGGPVSAGRTYLVGEEGPELVQFGASGFVTPADRTAAVLAAANRPLAPVNTSGGGVAGSTRTITNHFTLDRDADRIARTVIAAQHDDEFLFADA